MLAVPVIVFCRTYDLRWSMDKEGSGKCIEARLRKDLYLALTISARLCKCGTYYRKYQVQFKGLRLYTQLRSSDLEVTKFQFNQQNTLFTDSNFKQEYILTS